jgi:beta-glucosidase
MRFEIKTFILFFVSILHIGNAYALTPKVALYKDAKMSSEQRAHDLLGRMSLEDKIMQLMAVMDGAPVRFDTKFLADTAKMRQTFGKGTHSVQPYFGDIKETVEGRNKIQKYLLEKTKWGIPAIFVDEGQHGLMKPEATAFPMAIGLACSWNTALFEQVYTVAAREMRSRGAQWAFSPVIDVCRDPRWGRVEETYGEDPYLNGMYAIAAVKGLQGSSTGKVMPNHVASTLKHFCGHGQPEGGLNQAPANYSERTLREFHFPPFKMCIDNAHPVSVMPSYNEIDGVPSHANAWLLKDILRKEWGYDGMVISDWRSFDQLDTKHFIAKDKKDAAMMAFNAGVQVELPVANYYKFLPELLKEGKVKLSDIDNAVFQTLKIKFDLGLFENPYVDYKTAVDISKDPASKALALRSAQESIVLLKNENNILPLQKGKYKKIAVVGPCSNDLFTGGYSGVPYESVTILDGIKAKVGTSSEVLWSQGCKIVDNLSLNHTNWTTDLIKFTPREQNLKMIAEAIEVAKQADIILLAVGETEHLCREAWSKTHLGDNMTLDLVGEQQELVEAMVATGKPVVVYLMNGRPLSVNYIVKNCPAVIEGWYMGQETGTAAADILFGDVNPSGKLTITFPRSVGQVPMYYNHKPSAQFHGYVSMESTPLFPFGFGLSYTVFEYKNLRFSSDKIKSDGKTEVMVDVTNTGKMKGDEIVQMYINDKVSSVTRPVQELKGFERISLNAGETKTVTFSIDPSKLSFWNLEMNYVVEPGQFDVMIGKSSAEYIKGTLTVE